MKFTVFTERKMVIPPRVVTPDPTLPGALAPWRNLYLEAIFEPDRTQLARRIRVAEQALIEREHALRSQLRDSGERNAIIHALHCLRTLRACFEARTRPK